jgi:hypothetical protein
MEGSTPGYLEEIKKYLWRNSLLAKASKNSYHESTIEHEITVKKKITKLLRKRSHQKKSDTQRQKRLE